MRMWMVNPKYMCTKHLVGEHGEIHKHKHNFVKGHSIEKRIRWAQIEPASMSSRHDELASYLQNHKSPFEQPERHKRYSDKEWFHTINVDASLMLLLTKCNECKKKFRASLNNY